MYRLKWCQSQGCLDLYLGRSIFADILPFSGVREVGMGKAGWTLMYLLNLYPTFPSKVAQEAKHIHNGFLFKGILSYS